MPSRTVDQQPLRRRSEIVRTIAVRALAIVAFLLVGHDVLMTSPIAAHEPDMTSDHFHADERSTMAGMMRASDSPVGDDTMSDVLLVGHPSPVHEDSDCGVIREASMPAHQSVWLPDAGHDGAALTADPAADSSASSLIRSDARGPTQDAWTERAMLQIFQV